MTTVRENIAKIIRSNGTPNGKAMTVVGYLCDEGILSLYDIGREDPLMGPDVLVRARTNAARILGES